MDIHHSIIIDQNNVGPIWGTIQNQPGTKTTESMQTTTTEIILDYWSTSERSESKIEFQGELFNTRDPDDKKPLRLIT